MDRLIFGGKNELSSRSFNTDCAHQLRDDSKSRNVPFFFKQVDKALPIPKDPMAREFLSAVKL